MRKVSLIISLGILFAPALIQANVLPGPGAATITAAQGRSSIYGTVYGESRRPVADVYVELLDDVNSSIRQLKTDMSGRFQFTNLVDGRYMIKIRPGNTGYLEHIQQVVISAISSVRPSEAGSRGGGSDTQHIDIALRLDERLLAGPFSGAPSVVFAQAVPPGAKNHFDEGISFLRQKKETEGFTSLKKAIEIFPEYYDALDRLGGEYAVKGDADKSFLPAALVLLTKAVEVNPRGYSSVYGLGWTQYQLGMNTEAIETLGKATAIYGKAADAYLWQGKALRKANVLDKAEAALKRADELANRKVPDIHWQLAGLYNDQKRYREAADEMELYLKHAPKGEDPEKIKDLIKRLREKAK